MGGNCAVTIRRSDGTETRMDRWTNTMPWFFTSDEQKLFGEDPAYIAEYMQAWLDMKADWDANKETGNYKENMTEVYAPFPYGLKPSEYGLVVLDYKNKVILSHQMYSNLAGRKVIKEFLTPEKFDDPAFVAEMDEKYDMFSLPTLRDLKKAYAEKRIVEALFSHTSFTGEETFEYILRKAFFKDDNLEDRRMPMGQVTVAPPGDWKFHDYCRHFPPSVESKKTMYEHVQSLFELTDEEKAGFEEWIKPQEENEDD